MRCNSFCVRPNNASTSLKGELYTTLPCTRCGILQAYNMKFWKLHVRDRPSRREELAALGFVWGRCDKFLTLFNTTFSSCVFSLVLVVAMLVVMLSSVGVVYLGVGFGVNVVAAPPPATT